MPKKQPKREPYHITQVYAGEWNPIGRVRGSRRWRQNWVCCHCALAHTFTWRLRNEQLEYKCERNGGMTRAARAYKKKRVR